jgi:dienelactone hydrolase
MRAILGFIVLGVATGSALACGDGEPAPDPTCGGAAPYAARGPWSVGVLTLTRGSTVVEVWYPTTRGPQSGTSAYDLRDWLPADVAAKLPATEPTTYATDAVRDAALGGEGALPVALFSHGLAAYRSQSSFLTTHLASWGFVVAAPDHPERGLARLLENRAPSFSTAAGALFTALELVEADARFAGRLDTAKRAALGHSAGGGTAGVAARDPRIAAWVAMAAGNFSDVPAKPAMLMAGERDGIVSAASVEDAYEDLASPGRHLRVLRGFGHLAFSDICLIGRDRGGIVQIAVDNGIEVSSLLVSLAQDGCRASDVPAERGFPVIRHYTTATLRAGLGLDAAPRGLDAPADACFGTLLAESRQD